MRPPPEHAARRLPGGSHSRERSRPRAARGSELPAPGGPLYDSTFPGYPAPLRLAPERAPFPLPYVGGRGRCARRPLKRALCLAHAPLDSDDDEREWVEDGRANALGSRKTGKLRECDSKATPDNGKFSQGPAVAEAGRHRTKDPFWKQHLRNSNAAGPGRAALGPRRSNQGASPDSPQQAEAAWHNGRSSWHCSQIVRDVAPAPKLSARGKNTGLKEELKYIPSHKMEKNHFTSLILNKSPLSSLSYYKISSSTYVTKLIIRVK
nr:uncharacterized protein LOC118971384 [Manis javanica]